MEGPCCSNLPLHSQKETLPPDRVCVSVCAPPPSCLLHRASGMLMSWGLGRGFTPSLLATLFIQFYRKLLLIAAADAAARTEKISLQTHSSFRIRH